MNGFRVGMHEWAAIFRNRKSLISVIAVLLIPLLYSYLYLWAFWDPYERLADLPVAVVNQDAGAEMSGEKLSVGEELVKKLQEDQGMKWNFTSYEEGRQGLEDGRYYMMIEIPADFSRQVATVNSNNPAKAEIHYIPNESRNLLSAQFGERAVENMRASVQKKITEKYAEAIFDKMGGAGSGLGEAADGAQKLADGLILVKDGSGSLQSGAAELATGARKLGDGATRLSDGILSLEAGLQQTSEGGNQVASGLGQLVGKGNELAHAGSQLAGGLDQANQVVSGITPKISELNDGLKQAVPLSQDASQQWKELAAKHPELLQDPVAQQLAIKIGMLQAAVPKASEGVNTIAGYMVNLQPGMQQLTAGSKQLSGALDQYLAGIGAAKAGADKVAAGDSKLYAGAKQLAAGSAELSAGGKSLADGGSKLEAGTAELHGGADELLSGANTLASKLSEGSNEVKDGVVAAKEKAGMIADPVQVQESKLHPVPNYGTGFSPYFISLALYVGALLLFIILDVHNVAVTPKRATAWLFGKFMVYSTLGLLQAFIVAILLQKGLGLSVASKPEFYLMCFVISLTFISLIQGLIAILGDSGRFLAIVILMLQLTSSAGTFPLEMTPDFFKTLNPYLPMTYTVAGLKSSISNGDTSLFWSNINMLLLFIAGSTAITVLLSLRRHPGRKNKEELSANTVTA